MTPELIRLGPLQAESVGRPDAPLVLGVPGLTANLRSFDAIAGPAAASGLRFVSLDLRGRGLSELTGPGTYGWPAHATDVVRAADMLGADRFAVIGWSMGAFVTMEIARRVPDRLSRAVLIDAAGPVDDLVAALVRISAERLGTVYPSVAEYLELVKGVGFIQPWSDFWERYFRYELTSADGGGVRPRSNREAALEDFDYGMEHDPRELWPHLTMPVLLLRAALPISAQGGDVLSPGLYEDFKRSVPHAETHEVEANHYGIGAHPETVRHAVSFLTRAVEAPAR